ncbi:hypothetical protein BGZ70_008644 [Mortierella alpina]|uniref:Calcineurin-like phosphoesterase domain-containing protein n=1 Tax=Mortierella alpina TaxID=64518 RepID=A0A9P6J333_MORAP|nr:hypothetical protein BGZ70_008644 [Mortierella alpina]
MASPALEPSFSGMFNHSTSQKYETFKLKGPVLPPKSLPSDPFLKYLNYHQILLEDPLTFLPPAFSMSKEYHHKAGEVLVARTIVIGDTHGSLVGLNGFLANITFNPRKDRLIFAGDMVAKGPESLGVINRAMELNAKCVLGNHDDKVLRWKGFLNSLSSRQREHLTTDAQRRLDATAETAVEHARAFRNNVDPKSSLAWNEDHVNPKAQLSSIPSDLVENSDHHHIALRMTASQHQYLLSCPLIITLPRSLSARKVPIHITHAGIDPAQDVDKQLPWVLENIRTLMQDGTPSSKKKGRSWAKIFNDLKVPHSDSAAAAEDFLLLYGHDAMRSLNVKRWSIGLDSGCVYGGSLSGYVVETDTIHSYTCPYLGVDMKLD